MGTTAYLSVGYSLWLLLIEGEREAFWGYILVRLTERGWRASMDIPSLN